MAKWQCPYCGVETSITPEGRRRKAISGHLLNNHAEEMNAAARDAQNHTVGSD